jgi:hypothetical protein
MFKAHTGRIGKQLLNAILFLNKKGPSKSRYFLWEGVCGKLGTLNDGLRNVPTNFVCKFQLKNLVPINRNATITTSLRIFQIYEPASNLI